MAKRVNAVSYPLFPQDNYCAVLSDIRDIKRRAFNAAPDAPETEDGFRFVFIALDPATVQTDDNGLVIGGEQLIVNDTPVSFTLDTGVNYGTAKAILTKMVNQILGVQKLTDEQIPQLDIEKLVKRLFNLYVTVESTQTGTKQVNRLVGFKLDQKSAKPVEFFLTSDN